MATLIAGNRMSLANQSLEVADGTPNWDNNYGGSGRTFALAAEAAFDEGRGILLSMAAAGAATTYAEPKQSVTAGENLSASIWVKPSNAGVSAKLGVTWYAAGAFHSNAPNVEVAVPAGVWTKVHQTVTVPATVTEALCLVVALNVAAGGTAAFDRIYLGREFDPGPALLAPVNFTATAVSATQIDLAWKFVPGARSYQVERNGTLLSTRVLGLNYSDTGLTAGTAYTYRVRAEK